jgi:LmbE family N-acetylglucosaminyl deacetylase
MRERPVLSIFAHPDDEAFGPAGTLAQFARDRDVYSICVTNGDAGENTSDKTGDLAEIRREEVRESCRELGIKEVFFFDLPDGRLSNALYHDISNKIQEIVDDIQPEILVTFEPRGVTGHMDHIEVSMVTSFIFEKNPKIEELWQFCMNEERRDTFGEYYIYCPPGYKEEEISKTIDVSDVWEEKTAAMYKHESQKKDMQKALSQMQNLPKEECFIVRKRD